MAIRSLERDKTVTELRTIAQGLGVPAVLSKTRSQLEAAISSHGHKAVKKEQVAPELIIIDNRLRHDSDKIADQDEILELLFPLIERGLIIDFPDEFSWYMEWGYKNDSGTLSQPVRNIFKCAERLMR